MKEVAPRGIATTTIVYDSAGRAIAETQGVGTICRSYSAEGRLTQTTAPGEAQPTTYTYDPAGGQRTASHASGVVTSDYDEAGRVKKIVDSFGAEATLEYDREANLTRRTAAAGPLLSSPNYVTEYTYDDDNKLVSVTDPAGRTYAFSYDSRGNLHATQLPNGTFAWHDYNAGGWLTAVYNRHGTLPTPLPANVPADSEGSSLADFSYTHDLEGRKREETRTGGGLTTEMSTYTYDSLGRLSDVVLPDGTLRRYFFDLDSNRTEITENGQTTATYTYDPMNGSSQGVDQLTQATENGQPRSFAHRPDGEMISRGSDALSWDGWGRLTGGTFAGTTVSYSFDPLGFRRQRVAAGVSTRYLHGGLFETDAAGMITLSDVDGAVGDLAHYAGPPTLGSTVSFLYYNGHGDLAAKANSLGERTEAFTYDPFGGPRQALPANEAVERFTGRWDKKFDTASLLIEMGARPYDPKLGRFLAVDPIEGGAQNAYDYAGQDPVNDYDLDGTTRCVLGPCGGSGNVSRAAPKADYPKWKDPGPRKSTAKIRSEWEAANGKKWPKDKKGRNYDAHHKRARADGGTDEVSNIKPMRRDRHVAHHKKNGDFRRWGARRYSKDRPG